MPWPASDVSHRVFQVKYYVTGTLDESVQTILEGGGAKKTAYLSAINTHCIVGSDPDYNEVSNILIHVLGLGELSFFLPSNLLKIENRSVKPWTCWMCQVSSRSGFPPLFTARSFCHSGAAPTPSYLVL